MRTRSFVLPVLTLAMSTLLASPLHAQARDWTISVTADAGVFVPIRNLGKNAGATQSLPVLQVVADMNSAFQTGFGIELSHPSKDILVRAMYRTTVGGTVTGRLGLCGDPSDPLFTGAICQPVENDAKVQTFFADVGFIRGDPGSRLRPVIRMGLGVRKYSFGTVVCQDPSDWEVVCNFTSDIWNDAGGLTPTLSFGVGLQGELGPLTVRAEALDQVNRYSGGAGSADGNIQNDGSISLGLAYRIR